MRELHSDGWCIPILFTNPINETTTQTSKNSLILTLLLSVLLLLLPSTLSYLKINFIICLKNSDHIMPYRLPSVNFSDQAEIFFVVFLASHNPKTTIKKMFVCLSHLQSIHLLKYFWFHFHIWLIKRFPMGVFHRISVLTPHLSSKKKPRKYSQ